LLLSNGDDGKTGQCVSQRGFSLGVRRPVKAALLATPEPAADEAAGSPVNGMLK